MCVNRIFSGSDLYILGAKHVEDRIKSSLHALLVSTKPEGVSVGRITKKGTATHRAVRSQRTVRALQNLLPERDNNRLICRSMGPCVLVSRFYEFFRRNETGCQ